MNYTFHLTEKCNLNCTYCYEGEKGSHELPFLDIKKVLDNEVKNGSKKCQISFFGGEPLLKKELIYEVINYADELEKNNDIKFSYSITTNATLIDKDFIKLAKKKDFLIGISLDGNKETHNKNRSTYSGEETFDLVSDNTRLLLKSVHRVVAMPVITKNNYKDMVENVCYLFSVGFKHVNCAFDYTANWEDKDIEPLRKEYEKLADVYYEKTKNNNDFSLLPFDNKINTHVKSENCEERCVIATRHINVSSDGKFYPCMQYVGKNKYQIGDIHSGLDFKKIEELREYAIKNHNDICRECKIRNRCSHTCGCLNIITTGDFSKISALICETERMIIEISDRVAEKLYKEGSTEFYRKKYWSL